MPLWKISDTYWPLTRNIHYPTKKVAVNENFVASTSLQNEPEYKWKSRKQQSLWKSGEIYLANPQVGFDYSFHSMPSVSGSQTVWCNSPVLSRGTPSRVSLSVEWDPLALPWRLTTSACVQFHSDFHCWCRMNWIHFPDWMFHCLFALVSVRSALWDCNAFIRGPKKLECGCVFQYRRKCIVVNSFFIDLSRELLHKWWIWKLTRWVHKVEIFWTGAGWTQQQKHQYFA